MILNEKDFPLYTYLQQPKFAGVGATVLAEAFQKAVNGSDQEKYDFTAWIMRLARPADDTPLTDLVPNLKRDTFEGCWRVFSELASRGHKSAAGMAEYLEGRGFKPKNFSPAPSPVLAAR